MGIREGKEKGNREKRSLGKKYGKERTQIQQQNKIRKKERRPTGTGRRGGKGMKRALGIMGLSVCYIWGRKVRWAEEPSCLLHGKRVLEMGLGRYDTTQDTR